MTNIPKHMFLPLFYIFFIFLAGSYLASTLSFIPSNVKEIFFQRNVVFSSISFTLFFYILFALPLIFIQWVKSKDYLIYFPLLLLAHGLITWLILSDAAPGGSIHNILGSPTLNWPWEWEYLYRFYPMSMVLAGLVLLSALLIEKKKNSISLLTQHIVALIVIVFFAYKIIVQDAATDNLTELIRNNASLLSFLLLILATFTGVFSSVFFAYQRTQYNAKMSLAYVVFFVSIPLTFVLVWFGLENDVNKYNHTFPALQFLLTGDRQTTYSILTLFSIYSLVYIASFLCISYLQSTIWRLSVNYKPAIHKITATENYNHNDVITHKPDWLLFATYFFLIVYGTLFPFSEWERPGTDALFSLIFQWPSVISAADVVVNSVVYIPLGFFAFGIIRAHISKYPAFVLIPAMGFLISLTLEFTQLFLPDRSTSILDITLNTAGCFLGALIGNLSTRKKRYPQIYATYRQAWFINEERTNVALFAIILWVIYQLSPLVPSLDVGNLRNSLAPIKAFIDGQVRFDTQLFSGQFLSFLGIGLLLQYILKNKSRTYLLTTGFLLFVLMMKLPIVGLSLRVEDCSSVLIAIGLLYFTGSSGHKNPLYLSALALCLSYVLIGLRASPAEDALLYDFNWIPFALQMGDFGGIIDIFSNSWLFVALAYLISQAINKTRQTHIMLIGSVIIFIAVLAINIAQQHLPGRYPDLTDAIIASLAWLIAWHFLVKYGAANVSTTHKQTDMEQPPRYRNRKPVFALAGLALVLPIIILLAMNSAPLERALDQDLLAKLPTPMESQKVSLPNFKFTHPRLPSPSEADIKIINSKNSHYTRSLKHLASRNKLAPIITQEVLNPGSQDLNKLHKNLMALQFNGRGNVQVKPLAVAYDWLYLSWTEKQRIELAEKLAQGCKYTIDFIREERLSPYNVFLYNSPFQALMACAIALYDEHPDANVYMAFTYDLWINRVVPVWKQIMGENGGWHEGGEYVGIGIGQAIYQVPAMWRKATGEDIFQQIPGIEGFLDFIIYRTRPDETHIRWGDAGYFDRGIPDRLALAMEFNHQAAYSFKNKPRINQPSSWPWGPLTSDRFFNPKAIDKLPLVKHFDGIGLVISRSDWTSDATYITFKAGDNYWSHSHLDQGAFTLYSGGALAIDSGLYGPKYGADHHMNYTYQTIAHNLVTVYDPEDTVPTPKRKKHEARYIANDGGQRRIGSGWGIESAPLDINEWNAKKEIYHTATIIKYHNDDNYLAIIADLTPAYTNKYSGRGTFSHRTKRVEQYKRLFIYDKKRNTVIVYDTIKDYDNNFRKKWLLHSIEEPIINNDKFSLIAFPKEGIGNGGRELRGTVLLPKQKYIQSIGGKGFAFFVDQSNYDENGTLVNEIKRTRRRNSEPGNWRIEVIPNDEKSSGEFLVVLQVSQITDPKAYPVRLVVDEEIIKLAVGEGENRTHWEFKRDLSMLSVSESSNTRVIYR